MTIAPSAEQPRLLYADSSALVKLVIDDHASEALERHLAGAVLTTSRLAVVEVARATSLAHPGADVQEEVERLLASCLLVELSAELMRAAVRVTSRTVRSLDAIHLASALRVEADELVAYDRRLLAAAAAHGLAVSHPGAGG